MNIRELKAKVDELIERDPQAAIVLTRRIQKKLNTWQQQQVEQALRGTPPSEQELKKIARRHRAQGCPEEEIQAVLAYLKEPGPRDGMSFGGLLIEDIGAYVEALWRRGWGDLTLEIQFEHRDDDHLTLTILELGKAWWQEDAEGEP